MARALSCITRLTNNSPVEASSSVFGRHEFLIRRLHSLSGLIPVGAFLCIHLATNVSIVGGESVFQRNVDLIHSLGPLLPFVEWTFIFLPILFHAVVGVVIALRCQPNLATYRLSGNVRYTLQRVTAWIALVFIGWHVFHMHGWVPFEPVREQIRAGGVGARFDPAQAPLSARMALDSFGMKVVYGIGIVATVYHFANGLWTMGITWGLWTTPAAQRRADYVCGAVGVVLAAIGLTALAGFSGASPATPSEQEPMAAYSDSPQEP
jgi:succinate dehydrogenase / fumarate reductase cytochrome b subunit